MSRRAIIVHGWGGNPEEGWFPWAKRALEERGYMVDVPMMPNAEHPVIDIWVQALRDAVGTPDAELVLIGHSIGCQTIMRYLATSTCPVASVVLVAPWLRLANLEGHDEEVIAEPWLKTPIMWDALRKNAPKAALIFSDNDMYVELLNRDLFAAQWPEVTVVMVHGRGHINGEANVTELPEVLAAITGA